MAISILFPSFCYAFRALFGASIDAGCMAGRAEHVLKLIEDLLHGVGDGSSFPEDGDDQGRLHEHLLELGEAQRPLPFFVDSRCRIFQCLYEAEPQQLVVFKGEVEVFGGERR